MIVMVHSNGSINIARYMEPTKMILSVPISAGENIAYAESFVSDFGEITNMLTILTDDIDEFENMLVEIKSGINMRHNWLTCWNYEDLKTYKYTKHKIDTKINAYKNYECANFEACSLII